MKAILSNQKQRVGAILIVLAILSSCIATDISAEVASDGKYTVAVSALKTESNASSMLDSYLYKTADIEIENATGTITFYIKKYYTGTTECLSYVKDDTTELSKIENAATINDVVYDAYTYELSDLETERYTFEALIPIMNMVVNFDLCIDWDAIENGATEYLPDENTTQETQTVPVTAVVEETNEPTYSVTIPATIDLGTLSKSKDTTTNYNVKVTTSGFTTSSILTISAPSTGTLTYGSNTIPFSNTFGTHTFTKTSTKSASISVNAEDVVNASAGSYNGTTIFTIKFTK